jgi:hypothetical protein
MREPCSILIFCVLLGFGVSLAIPTEDVAETAYNESEALPYEGTPLFSSVVLRASARALQPVSKSGPPFHLGSPTRRCERCAEHKAWLAHPVFDSLIILDHSLRC